MKVIFNNVLFVYDYDTIFTTTEVTLFIIILILIIIPKIIDNNK
ncbi:hypothetical protein HMPREF1860_01358 [Prevotella amnii]|uniref:Uncharacterized protein n=2 Tax=Prevotella amnii TaxID=419005 RepID=A0A134BBZ7_9BACT|nr:hypothetical protein HMPREF9018_0180 [Prevotella amnii CRIS 21A-A]KXB77461.1 hypothetical protein HMPREF1860_01358 [Prevotella amnii]